MPCNSRSFVSSSILALLAALVTAGNARAQDDPWARLVLEADSIGPETPRFAPSRWTPCEAIPAADSVRVAGPSEEFLLGARSLRTRGMFTYRDLPETGSGTFALRAILCGENGRPRTIVVEREHRYFYLVFSLRDLSRYNALTLLRNDGACFRWAEESQQFVAAACRGSGGAKC